jgi:hypothetical protein
MKVLQYLLNFNGQTIHPLSIRFKCTKEQGSDEPIVALPTSVCGSETSEACIEETQESH